MRETQLLLEKAPKAEKEREEVPPPTPPSFQSLIKASVHGPHPAGSPLARHPGRRILKGLLPAIQSRGRLGTDLRRVLRPHRRPEVLQLPRPPHTEASGTLFGSGQPSPCCLQASDTAPVLLLLTLSPPSVSLSTGPGVNRPATLFLCSLPRG